MMRIATQDDVDALAQLINEAFAVELFFKRGDRTSPDDVSNLMREGEFLIHDREDGPPAACVFVKHKNGRGYFGMLSVSPDIQGRGLARRIVAEVEERLLLAGCHALDIYVVNLRTELPPFYRKLGYVESGTSPFPHPDEATQPCHIIVMTKSLVA
jgi:N-acetylglutamate synthase-like GNAT family acetyltransferase